MSTTTTAETTATATKAPAKKAPATKAPAKKPAPAKKAAEPAAKKDGKTYVYEATSRAGITNRRSFPHQVAVAADVRDPEHPSARWQKGVVTRFFATTEQAEKYAERQRESGCDVVLVEAKLVEEKQA